MSASRKPFLAVLALVAGAVLVPAAALPAAAEDDAVDDFDYSSWEARYDLSLDDEGRAVLHAEERVVADFPEHDQNRGIVRGFATRYQGAPLGTTIESVTDADGSPVPFETDEDDGTLFVLTGTDDYVHGPTEYVISYAMRDVLFRPDDAEIDEFFWDLLPQDSTQGIGAFRAEIVVDAALADRLEGSTSCYQGPVGSTDRCDLAGPVETADGALFTVESAGLDAGDGVTVAIGFEPGTVVPPPARRPDALADFGPLVGGILALITAVTGGIAVGAHHRRRRRATGVIVAQYDVPATLPPLLAGALIPAAKTPVAAEIVHLAVRGSLRIEDRGDKRPRLHRVDGHRADADGGDPLDREMIDALFPDAGTASVKVPRSSESFATRMTAMQGRGAEEASARGLTTKTRTPIAMVLVWIAIAFVGVTLILTIRSAIQGRESFAMSLFALILAIIAVAVCAMFAFTKHTVLTRAGAEQYEHLQGVAEFIRVAEADRLRMLQSYTGAERYTRDGVELIHVYERLLPYAMLFGLEKEWGEVLENRYAEYAAEPGWFVGYQTGFFLGALTNFGQSTQSATQYTAPSTSSSSSSAGSFGGGFSGGGGGGGFSGGR